MTKASDKELGGYFATLSASKYMLLTTFRRDGRAVAPPVHVVAEADKVFFRTWDVSGKVKRLRHTPTVEVAPCSSRGHPVLHGRLIPWYHRLRGRTTQQYRPDPS